VGRRVFLDLFLCFRGNDVEYQGINNPKKRSCEKGDQEVQVTHLRDCTKNKYAMVREQMVKICRVTVK